MLLNVRLSLAASLHEIIKLVNMASKDNQSFFTAVLKHFTTDDIDQVKGKVSEHLCSIISAFPEPE